jgi:hypothetical protein
MNSVWKMESLKLIKTKFGNTPGLLIFLDEKWPILEQAPNCVALGSLKFGSVLGKVLCCQHQSSSLLPE